MRIFTLFFTLLSIIGLSNNLQAVDLKNDKLFISGPTDYVCVGRTINLEAMGPQTGYEFHWYPVNKVTQPTGNKTSLIVTETTTIFVERVASSALNHKRDTAYITIKVKEIKGTIYGPDFVCLGDKATLEVSPNLDQPIWSTGEKKHQIEVNKPGIYSVRAYDGCRLVKAEHYVDSKTQPLSRIMLSRNTDLCVGDEVILTSFSKNNVSWSTEEQSRSITVNKAGTYTLSNHNECGADVAEVTVQVHPVQASFIPSISEARVDQVINFRNYSDNAIRYEWYQDDVLFSEDKHSDIRFQSIGRYEIKLVAINEYGCKDVMKYPVIEITEADDFQSGGIQQDLIFPNAFTPNGDSKNDVFEIKTGQITRLEVTIFDRWGKVVLTAENTSGVSWNGTNLNGDKLPTGQYVMRYSYINKFGEPISNTSAITLLR